MSTPLQHFVPQELATPLLSFPRMCRWACVVGWTFRGGICGCLQASAQILGGGASRGSVFPSCVTSRIDAMHCDTILGGFKRWEYNSISV
jgi:hypothetical protein